MRLIDADALKDAIMQEVYKDRVGVFVARRIFKLIDRSMQNLNSNYKDPKSSGSEDK